MFQLCQVTRGCGQPIWNVGMMKCSLGREAYSAKQFSLDQEQHNFTQSIAEIVTQAVIA